MTPEKIQPDNLETVIATQRTYLQKRQEKTPNAAVVALAEMQARPQPVLNVVTGGAHVTLIGQIVLQDTYDPVSEALRYVRDGADAVSLFTDQRVYSKGMEDLLLVARGIRSTPVICQNYILNEYHVTEVRAAGASAVVVYSSILDRPDLRKIISLAHRWKMTTIVQVSTEEEMTYAASLSPHVIGFGDATTPAFDPQHDIALIQRLKPLLPFYCRMMPLGCIQDMDDVASVIGHGVDAIIADQTLIAPRASYERLRALLDRRAAW